MAASIQPLWRVKIVWRARRVWRIAVWQSAAPIFGLAAVFQMCVLLGGLWVLRAAKGESAMIAESQTAWAFIMGAALMFVPFLAVSIVWAIIKAGREEAAEGTWQGREFLYHTPLVVGVMRVDVSQGPVVRLFKTPLPNGSYVAYEVVFQPDAGYWNAVPTRVPSMVHGVAVVRDGESVSAVSPRGGSTLTNKAELELQIESRRPNARDVLVRVLIHSWKAP